MRFLSPLFLLLVAACASRPFAIEATFDADQAARLVRPGSNVIIGSGLLRQRGGGVVTCAGKEVRLIPLTAYAAAWGAYEFEWTGVAAQSGLRPADWRPYAYLHPDGFLDHQRVTHCDAQGTFRFDSVADGRFYLTTDVSWVVGHSPQGGKLVRIVEITGGKRHDIVITN